MCIVKGGKILFESRSRGVASFLTAAQELKENLEGSCVADKVVGKAVALLCVHFKIAAVYADILSRPAKAIFEKWSLYFEYSHLVENVLNAERTSLCPFEQLVKNVLDPSEAYEKLVNYGSVRKVQAVADERAMNWSTNDLYQCDEEELKHIRKRSWLSLRREKR